MFAAIGSLIKKAPKVPRIAPIEVANEQAKAVQGNISNFGLVDQLSKLANESLLETGLTNIDALLGKGTREQITSTIQSGLKGELPADVVDKIRRLGAERTGGGGYAGSQMARNLTLRDLGLTSLQRTDTALSQANQWLATSGSQVRQFDFSSMFVTPAQAIAQANVNQQNTFQRDWLSNQLKNAYSPSTIWGDQLTRFNSFLENAAGSYLGGVFGGVGG